MGLFDGDTAGQSMPKGNARSSSVRSAQLSNGRTTYTGLPHYTHHFPRNNTIIAHNAMVTTRSISDTTQRRLPVLDDTWTSSFCTWVITELSIWQSRSPQNPRILSSGSDGHPSLASFDKLTQYSPRELVIRTAAPRVQSSVKICLVLGFLSPLLALLLQVRPGGGKALGFAFWRLYETLSAPSAWVCHYYYW